MILLKAAMLFMALASAVLCGTFFYVWRFMRQRHVLLWGLAWLVSIPHLMFAWRCLEHPSPTNLFFSHLTVLLNALLMVAGCYAFERRRFPTRALMVLGAPLLGWLLLAPHLPVGLDYANAPGAVLLGLSYLWAAQRFERLYRERNKRGSRLVAALFLLAGLHEFDYPFLVQVELLNVAGYYLAAVLALAIALCLLIIILEDSRSDVDRERARLRGILDHLPVGVLMVSPDGDVQLVNNPASELLDIAVDTDFGNVSELEARLFVDSGNERFDGDWPLSRALRTREPTAAQQMVLRVGSTSRAMLVNAGPVLGDDRRLLGAVSVFQDIKELQRTQAELARAERLQGLGTLAAGVAHDFNNALTLVLGHAELAAAGATDPEVRAQIEIIASVARDSATIVRRIQDLARTRVGHDHKVFDLAEVARQVIDLSRPRWRDQAQAAGVHYEVATNLQEGLMVAGEDAELREALLNLVLNALDAMPDGGSLGLAVTRDDASAILAVTDTGPGIPEAIVDHVFDPFFTTKGDRGTGLGLSVVFGIVRRHGGTIAVDSRIGHGATFSIQLPLAAADHEQPAEAAPVALERQLHILVADDDPLVCELAATLLQRAGHQVDMASGGEEAIRKTRETSYDVVLTDLGMPDVNGWQVAQAVRDSQPDLPVILVTGWAETVSAEQATVRGVAHILSKPYSRAELLRCVQHCTAPALTAVG